MSENDLTLEELESYTLNVNKVKDLILERLPKDGLISNEQLDFYSENWQVIIAKLSWLERAPIELGTKTENSENG